MHRWNYHCYFIPVVATTSRFILSLSRWCRRKCQHGPPFIRRPYDRYVCLLNFILRRHHTKRVSLWDDVCCTLIPPISWTKSKEPTFFVVFHLVCPLNNRYRLPDRYAAVVSDDGIDGVSSRKVFHMSIKRSRPGNPSVYDLIVK